jgi:protein-tyrosine phosphatase
VALDDRSRHGGVDEIPLPGAAGRLWLCGKHFIGPDVVDAIAQVGATTVVCLNEAHELESRYPAYVEWLRANRDERAVWAPVPDLHAPDLETAVALVELLRARLDAGETLLVHCGAGFGRAGTMAAALLLRYGTDLPAAVDTVARHRPMAGPEAGVQRDLLEELARFWA